MNNFETGKYLIYKNIINVKYISLAILLEEML